jgi:hypothetical protein
MLTCAFGSVLMIYITSPWVSLFAGLSWTLSFVLVFVPKALPFVKKIYNKIPNPGICGRWVEWLVFLLCGIGASSFVIFLEWNSKYKYHLSDFK